METIQIDKNKLRWFVAPEIDEASPQRESTSNQRLKARPRKPVSQAKLIFALAKMHGYENVRKVGEGDLIDQPIKTNGWLVMPIEMYKGIIPREARETAETITKGIAIKGFLIADDMRSVEGRREEPKVLLPKVSPDWGKIASGAGKVAAAIAVGGAIISILPVVLGIGAITLALAYDPLLIAVTAENEWICVYQWWD